MARPRKTDTTVEQESLQPVLMIKRVDPSTTFPTKGTEKATCYDVYLPSDITIPMNSALGTPVKINLGLTMEIPEGYDVRLYLRSSVARDTALIMSNSVGILDEDFRGELCAYVHNLGRYTLTFPKDRRLFQIELNKKPEYSVEEAVEIAQDTERGLESGSTGE